MTVPVLLLTAAFAAPQQEVRMPSPAVPPIAARFDIEATDQQRQKSDDNERQTGERPHQIGVGANMGLSSRGGGGAFRLFMTDQLGFNFSANYYSGARYATVNGRTIQGHTFAVMPSVIYMITKPNILRDVDIRPYVGAGFNYVYASQPVPTTVPGVRVLESQTGMGGQVFGGAEMTFRSADYITISFEGTYYRLPVTYVNAALADGFTYALAFHFYLK